MKKLHRGYEKFGEIDLDTYKRKNKLILDPVVNYKLHKAAKMSNLPFEMIKQNYVQTKYNIPSDSTLELMKIGQEAFRSSENAPRLSSLQFSPLGIKYV